MAARLPWVASFVFTGCLSTASYHTAEPVPPGTTQMGLAAELDTVVGEGDTDEVYLTQPRVYVRKGLRERMALGLTAGAFGTAADLNAAIAGGESYTVSVNPYQGLALTQGFGADAADSDLRSTTLVGVLADLRLTDSLTFTGGLKPGLVIESTEERSRRETEADLFLAGSLGMRIGLASGAHLFPELNVVRGLTNRSGAWPDGTVVKFGVGVGF